MALESLEEHKARHAEYTTAVVGAFGRAAATFGQVGPDVTGVWGDKLVGLVAPAPGERVLDVATGRGAVLLRTAERVGPRGRVTGVDLAPSMIEALAVDVKRLRLTHVDLRTMDAERLEFPDGSYDCVTCGLGLMFFAHAAQALAGFRRVLRPRGRLGLSYVPWEPPRNSRWAWRRELLLDLGVRRPPPNPASPMDEGGLRSAVIAAGFENIQIVEDRVELRFSGPDEYWAWTWSHVDRALYDAMDEPTLARYRARALEHLAAQHARGELTESLRVLLLTALAREPGAPAAP
jgi:SAM-dependent methyltransferase